MNLRDFNSTSTKSHFHRINKGCEKKSSMYIFQIQKTNKQTLIQITFTRRIFEFKSNRGYKLMLMSVAVFTEVML